MFCARSAAGHSAQLNASPARRDSENVTCWKLLLNACISPSFYGNTVLGFLLHANMEQLQQVNCWSAPSLVD